MNKTQVPSATEAWLERLNYLMQYGKHHNPRGMDTIELLGSTLEFDMNRPVIYHELRKSNYRFMASEAEFIANGDNRVASLSRYNKNIAQFSDDGLIFNGNYGEPFNSQVGYVVNTLLNDPSSRQAVLTIWQPNPVVSKDIRCTVSMQFLIRDGEMHTMVYMRSSDAVWGLCYDVFNFVIMTLRILTLFNSMGDEPIMIRLGTMKLIAGSSHIYEQHYGLVATILNLETTKPNGLSAPEVTVPDRALNDWKYIANSLVVCKEGTEDQNPDAWIINPNKLVGM